MLRKIVSLSGARRAGPASALDRLITASGLFDPEWYSVPIPTSPGSRTAPSPTSCCTAQPRGARQGRGSTRRPTSPPTPTWPSSGAIPSSTISNTASGRAGRWPCRGRLAPPRVPMAGGRLDIFDEAMIAAAAGPGLDPTLGTFEPSRLQPALRSGIRIVLELLRHRDLRVRFPRALHEGPDGPSRASRRRRASRALRWPGACPLDRGRPRGGTGNAGASSPRLRCRPAPPGALFLMPTGAWMACRTLFAALRDGA